jgi:WD40 repeat protein
MASVFLSYSRQDQPFVRRLFDGLTAAGKDVWVDWAGIPPSAQWLEEVFAGIDGADAFIFVMSPDSLVSQTCATEVAHALENRKRIIPLVCRELSAHDVQAVPALAPLTAINWIFFRPSDDFTTAFAMLRFALDTDLEYWHLSSALLIRAKQWEAGTKNANLTLRGPELAAAERWLAEGADKEPRPTALQAEYIVASRRATAARQRRLLTGVSTALVVTLLLAVISSVLFQQTQVQNAQLNQKNAQLVVRALAGAASDALSNNRIDQALLLGAEAVRRQPDAPEARDTLFNSLEYSPYLDAILQSQASRTDGGRSVAFSADGTLLMSASISGHITLWDVAHKATKRQLTAVYGGCTDVRYATISPDGRVVATMTRASSVCTAAGVDLWDAQTGNHLAHLQPAAPIVSPLNGLAFSPNGMLLAVVESGGVVSVWDVAAKRMVRQVVIGGSSPLSWVTVSPDGATAAAGNASAAALWDLTTGAVLHRLGGGAFGGAFSPDGKRLALGGPSGGVQLVDVSSGALIGGIIDGFAAVAAIAFSSDGRFLTFNNENNNSLLLWDTVYNTPVGAPLQAHTSAVIGIAASAAGQQFASIGDDDRVVLWRFAPASAYSLPLGSHLDGLSAAALSPDGKLLATCNGTAGQITLWNVASATPMATLGSGVRCQIVVPGNSLAFNAQGTLLALGQSGGQISLWDVASRREQSKSFSLFSGTDNTVTTVAFSPDGSLLAASSLQFVAGATQADKAAVWEVSTGTEIQSFDAVTDLAFSPDGKTLALAATGTAQGEIRLWSVSARGVVATFPTPAAAAEGVAYSPDGTMLAAIDGSGSVRVWDVATGKADPSHDFIGGTSRSTGSYRVAFSPDGKILAATDRSSIVLWDVRANQPWVRPIFDPATFYNVLFSPDGQYLVETQALGPVIVRYVTPTGWAALACRIANRNLTQAEWKQFVGAEPYQKTCHGLPAGQ